MSNRSSIVTDLADAAVALKSPLTKLVLIGFIALNLIVAFTVLGLFGFDRHDINQWFLTIFFGALALTFVEWSLWDRLIRKLDKEHYPDVRILIGGFTVSLLLAVAFGCHTHSEAQQAIELQKQVDADQAESAPPK